MSHHLSPCSSLVVSNGDISTKPPPAEGGGGGSRGLAPVAVASAAFADAKTCDLLACPSPLAVRCAAVSESACLTALPAATALASPTRRATLYASACTLRTLQGGKATASKSGT